MKNWIKVKKGPVENLQLRNAKYIRPRAAPPHLDGNYTVYGQVTKGMEVVNKIQNVKRDNKDRPEEDQKIVKVRVKKKFLFFWI